MVRGKYYFICPGCGHIFKAYDVEFLASSRSMPVHCPKCHAHAVKILPAVSSLNLGKTLTTIGTLIGNTYPKRKM